MAILGNFVNRAMVLTHKYFNGEVPAAGMLTETDTLLATELGSATEALTAALETFHFREALKQAMEIAKTDMERVKTILNIALQLCANIAVAFEPFTPFMSEKLAKMLGLSGKLTWDMLGKLDIISAGTTLATPELLFDKIEDSQIEAQLKRLADTKKANEAAAWKAEPQAKDVEFDTFAACDLRVGTVLECVKVPKADKLLRFLIDDGLEKRTIVSGIAKYYKPEELVGKQVCFIANLPPRKLKGIVSEGMILSAENSDGSIVLLSPSAAVAPGAKIG